MFYGKGLIETIEYVVVKLMSHHANNAQSLSNFSHKFQIFSEMLVSL